MDDKTKKLLDIFIKQWIYVLSISSETKTNFIKDEKIKRNFNGDSVYSNN